ncbi:MAG: matrixin family metalloprotease [Polyangiaceae bacterium]|nr:matrixin family metalloprotease [Polyangiaceae bacterium]
MVRSTPAIFAALTALFVATRADAYCRSTVCKDIDACDGEEVPGCPPLYWPGNCVGYSVQQDGGSGLDADTVDLIADLAFDQWRGADCGGEKPGLFIQNFGQVQCHAVEYNNDATDAANANIVLFSDDWPHSEATHTFALTTTTYDPVTGELLNADIELNARDHHFTVNDDAIEADLLSVLTHETGHFLGLAHSEDTDATMFPFYEEGTTELRTLTADDMEGICAIYPPDPSIDASCNPLPRHGFSPLCRDDQNEGRCTISAPASRSTREALPFALVAAALAMRARSRFKRR